MKNRVITISREFGSGGRTIGKKVAEELGIPCYDSELIQQVAEKSGFNENYIKDASEYAPGGFFASALSYRTSGPNNADYLWKIQYKVITDLAEKGPCVIVGRCADYILRDKADCLKVFVHADMAFRAERIVKVYGEREESPEQRLKDKDKRRATYHRFYTNMKWVHAQNDDITLNSGTLGIDRCVEILKELYERLGRTERQEPGPLSRKDTVLGAGQSSRLFKGSGISLRSLNIFLFLMVCLNWKQSCLISVISQQRSRYFFTVFSQILSANKGMTLRHPLIFCVCTIHREPCGKPIDDGSLRTRQKKDGPLPGPNLFFQLGHDLTLIPYAAGIKEHCPAPDHPAGKPDGWRPVPAFCRRSREAPASPAWRRRR